MKQTCYFALVILCFLSCNKEQKMSSVNRENWNKREASLNDMDSLAHGATYLSVYSEVYSFSEEQTNFLTVTVSMRNIDPKSTVYIKKADYYDTEGELIRAYFEKPIYIKPLETVEIVIDENDETGGVGGNFIFEWAIPDKNVNMPYFEGVMISTKGQQGLSFATQGVMLKN